MSKHVNKPKPVAEAPVVEMLPGMCEHRAYPGINCRECEAKEAALATELRAMEAQRKMKTGSGVGGRRKGRQYPKDGAPLRKVVRVITQGNLFIADSVELECGHQASSWGGIRARCPDCKKAEPIVTTKTIELERVCKHLNLNSQDIRLMAGELSAQEVRAVKAVLAGIQARIVRDAGK